MGGCIPFILILPLNLPLAISYRDHQRSLAYSSEVGTSDVVETTCFETKTEIKTKTFFRDQDRSFSETFGLRPRPGIIETKIETGNYSVSKNKPKCASPLLINLFVIFPKSYNDISSKRGFFTFSKRALLSMVVLSTRLC